jgi:hypothetical protein
MNRIRFENRRQILQGIQSLMGTLKNEGGIFLQDFGKSTTDYKVSDHQKMVFLINEEIITQNQCAQVVN